MIKPNPAVYPAIGGNGGAGLPVLFGAPLRAGQLTQCNSDAVQTIRLFVDVLFLGPFLIWLGLTPTTRLSPLLRSLLVVAGVGTIVFNGVNFLLIESRRSHPAIPANGGTSGGVGGREQESIGGMG